MLCTSTVPPVEDSNVPEDGQGESFLDKPKKLVGRDQHGQLTKIKLR